jgi:hypothetical protein
MREITMFLAEGVPSMVIHLLEGEKTDKTYVAPPVFSTPAEANSCEAKYERQRFLESFLSIPQDWMLERHHSEMQAMIEEWNKEKPSP